MMAPTRMAHLLFILQAFTLILWTDRAESFDCTFPNYIKGDYFSMEDGVGVTTSIDDRKWDDLECKEKFDHPKPVLGTEGANHTFLVSGVNDDCLYCIDVLWRTQNVLQFKKGGCIKDSTGYDRPINQLCESINYGLPGAYSMTTMFKRKDTVDMNCKSTFEGVFQFTYEEAPGIGGICDNPENQIRACQDLGSQNIDNQVFRMRYSRCQKVPTSKNKLVRYLCLGTWFEMRGADGYTFAVIADVTERNETKKFKCLMTTKDHKEAFNKERWAMSRFADCQNLNSIWDAPVRLVLTRIPPPTTYLTPQCSLQRSLTGTWRALSRNSFIGVNDTHIYLLQHIYGSDYLDTYYSCQHSEGTRYLMKQVPVRKCDVVYFTCFEFEFLPPYDDLVMIKVSEPYPYKQTSSTTNVEVKDLNKELQDIFRIACSKEAYLSIREHYELVK